MTTLPPLSPVARNSPSWLNSTVEMMSATNMDEFERDSVCVCEDVMHIHMCKKKVCKMYYKNFYRVNFYQSLQVAKLEIS